MKQNILFQQIAKGAKAAFKPVSLAVLGTILSVGVATKSQAQVIDTTITTGYGQIGLKNIENNVSVNNANIYLRPINTGEVTLDTTYFFQGGVGSNYKIDFNLPISIDTTYIDTSTNTINENLLQGVKLFPNNGSDVNISFNKHTDGTISILDMSGKVVNQEFLSGNSFYKNLENLPQGMYIINVQTQDNKVFSEKYLKQDVPARGIASRPQDISNNIPSHSNLKNLLTNSAIYEVGWFNTPGYPDGSIQLILYEGDNGLHIEHIQPNPETVMNLKINLWELFGDNGLANGEAYIKDINGAVQSAITDSTGTATFVDIGAEQEYTICVGKQNHKFWEGMAITTPEATILGGDTTTIEKNYTIIPDTFIL